eukprot:TRINITY_DN781937_c0_g1_i1.p1 TRINITY_DN781937_c0_g1~~TRINITY_DN781937_c0_g1_i1.p1  ORF type:complete len:258 (-),score=40.45 TRINITY_DN781937_c0_g1_i1:233-937(-)
MSFLNRIDECKKCPHKWMLEDEIQAEVETLKNKLTAHTQKQFGNEFKTLRERMQVSEQFSVEKDRRITDLEEKVHQLEICIAKHHSQGEIIDSLREEISALRREVVTFERNSENHETNIVLHHWLGYTRDLVVKYHFKKKGIFKDCNDFGSVMKALSYKTRDEQNPIWKRINERMEEHISNYTSLSKRNTSRNAVEHPDLALDDLLLVQDEEIRSLYDDIKKLQPAEPEEEIDF